MEKLGRALGFSQAAINRYLATNRLEGKVTSKGTRDMLFAWRQNTSPANHETTMKTALQKSGLNFLAHKHLEETSWQMVTNHYFFIAMKVITINVIAAG